MEGDKEQNDDGVVKFPETGLWSLSEEDREIRVREMIAHVQQHFNYDMFLSLIEPFKVDEKDLDASGNITNKKHYDDKLDEMVNEINEVSLKELEKMKDLIISNASDTVHDNVIREAESKEEHS